MPLFYYSVEFLAHHVTVAWISGKKTASRNKISVLKKTEEFFFRVLVLQPLLQLLN